MKGSRRDQSNVVRINGEAGTMTAAVWCRDHIPNNRIVHHISDIIHEGGPTALQLFVQTSKQADLALTGTVRKATLITQSTKALPITLSNQQTGNRRVSTTTVNGTTSSARGAGKPDEGVKDLQDAEDEEKTCATCKTHVTPKWWPFPPPNDELSAQPSALPEVLPSTEKEPELSAEPAERILVDAPKSPNINGTVALEDANAGTVALAAAALHQEPVQAVAGPVEVQCHKCHFRKVKKESTPVPSPSPPLVAAPAEPTLSQHGAPNPSMDPYASEGPLPEVGAHYAWPHPQGYNPTPITWHRPSPNPQGMMNGTHSPHAHYGHMDNNHGLHHYPPSGPAINGQPHMRSSIPPMPHSPHQNGQLHHLPNGYPPSPHRIGPPAPLTNGGYSGYGQSPRPPSQHMTNGIHSPHVAERSFSSDYSTMNRSRGPSFGNAPTSPPGPRDPFYTSHDVSPRGTHPSSRPMQSDYPPFNTHRVSPSFGAPLASPSIPLDPRLQPPPPPPPINGHPPTNDRPAENRVNGGASASPSVRNLLS